MRSFRRFAVVSALFVGGAGLVATACGEDEATVRPRLDAGAPANDAGQSDSGSLSCGVVIPTKYESAAFTTNAAVEIALAKHFEDIEDKIRETEGASTTQVSAADLKALFGEGAPSLRAVSTPSAQTIIDGYFDELGAAMGKTWTPADAEQDGGAASGGKYGTFHFSKTGVDLRETTEKTLLGGALYNHVLGLVAAPITEATVDRLLAAFGASTAFANRTDADAGAEKDELIAEYASRRDDKSSASPGSYRKIKTALLTMKAAVPAGERCKADLDAAVATFLLEWERVTYATAVYYLNAAALAAADPQKGPQALHAYGEALGFVQSFKGLPADKRKITDAQIEALLTKIGATTPYKLVTNPGDRALGLNGAINDIALYEGFTPAEVEAFRKNF